MAAAHHAQIMLQVQAFRFLFEIVNHNYLSDYLPAVWRIDRRGNKFAVGVGRRRQTATVL